MMNLHSKSCTFQKLGEKLKAKKSEVIKTANQLATAGDQL
jgi:hypothetical protein